MESPWNSVGCPRDFCKWRSNASLSCLAHVQRPSCYEGFTQVVANDQGHLLQGVPRSTENPWGNFVGTWDLPLKIPGNVTTFMARSDPAARGIVKGRRDHEDYMRRAAGSPVKEQTTKVGMEEI